MARRTLTFRLIASSVVLVAGSLLAAGVLLVLLFRDHIERRFDAQLGDHLEELVAASEVGPDGRFRLTWRPSDPRFNRPYSGWYWQIFRDGEVVARSDSVWRSRLRVMAPASRTIQEFKGPQNEPVRGLVAPITLPGGTNNFVFVIAGPISDIEHDVANFTSKLVATLGVLGLGLVAAVLVQVRFGLQPLRTLQGALTEIRAGHRDRLPDDFAAEVEPVVRELNALLDHNTSVLDRCRTQTGNLAHALKNPMTVIRNEARDVGGAKGEILREQAMVVSKLIGRYLGRARIAASGAVLRARTPVAATIDDLTFSLERLYRQRGCELLVEPMDGLYFQGDAEDLEEMVANLMDNACKWARRQIRVSAACEGGRLRITVEDDGPGIPAERRAAVLERGLRLDETVAGSGLGLDIVQDIAELYGGSLDLGVSSMGGLRAELELPHDRLSLKG